MVKLCKLNLLGPLSLVGADGTDLTPSSARACAVIAMLATAPNARRGRKWLQDKLWSASEEKKGEANLRQALYVIRKKLGPLSDLMFANKSFVKLDLDKVSVDLYDPDLSTRHFVETPDFLEGIDIDDPEFDDWLREHREYWFHQLEGADPNLDEDRTAPLRRDMQAGPAQKRYEVGVEKGPMAVGDIFEKDAQAEEKPLRMAVAVLPLINKTANPSLAYFADGFSEDLIDRVSRLRWVPVIARASSFSFGTEKRDLVAISDQLRARYILDGEIAELGKKYMVRIRLNNMDDGSTIWTKPFELSETFERSQIEETLIAVVSGLDAAIDSAEQTRSVSSIGSGNEFDEHIWRGRWHLGKLTAEDSKIARHHLDIALGNNPNDPEALIQSGLWHLLHLWTKRGTRADIEAIQPELRRAHLADIFDARGYALLGMSELWLNKHDNAVELFTQAINRNPSFAKAHEQLGTCFYLMGRPEDAILSLEEAIRLSPHDQHLFFLLGELAMSKLMAGHPKDAVLLTSQALMYRPKYWYAHMVKLSALEKLGDKTAYTAAKNVFHSTGTQLNDTDFEWIPFQDPSWIAALKRHLD